MMTWFVMSGQDDRAIADFMARVSALPAPGGVQDSSHLWWKAQLLMKWDAERRAQRPLDIMQPIEIAGGLVAAGLLLYWSIPYLL